VTSPAGAIPPEPTSALNRGHVEPPGVTRSVFFAVRRWLFTHSFISDIGYLNHRFLPERWPSPARRMSVRWKLLFAAYLLRKTQHVFPKNACLA
jgi:hypothetical protein